MKVYVRGEYGVSEWSVPDGCFIQGNAEASCRMADCAIAVETAGTNEAAEIGRQAGFESKGDVYVMSAVSGGRGSAVCRYFLYVSQDPEHARALAEADARTP